MWLFVLRHGQAGEADRDELRELTARGRSDLAKVLSNRCRDLSAVEHIRASPLVRAQQTAAIASQYIDNAGDIVEDPLLVPWSTPVDFLNSIELEPQQILAASHQPFVSHLVEYLTGDAVAMPTSALVAIETEFWARGCGQISWCELA